MTDKIQRRGAQNLSVLEMVTFLYSGSFLQSTYYVEKWRLQRYDPTADDFMILSLRYQRWFGRKIGHSNAIAI